jgi:hypothetical protein
LIACRRVAADHVADMQLRGLVVGHVDDLEALVEQRRLDLALLVAIAQLDADRTPGLLLVGVAIVELGDLRLPSARQKARKLPGRSGMPTANRASRCSPTSARSAM